MGETVVIMKGKIKAVGFDLDGTLFETHVDYSSLYDCDKVVLKKHGIPFLDVFGDNPEIKRIREPIRLWLVQHSREDEFAQICKEIDELSLFYEEQFVTDAKEYPRSIECMRELKSKGVKIGLLTRGGHHYAETVLKQFGVYELMDAVVGRDYTCYDEAKPSPIAMMHFAKELGVKPDEILYLGDNLTDYRSAVGAGATFIGVLSGAASLESWNRVSPGMRVIDYAGDVVDIIDEYI